MIKRILAFSGIITFLFFSWLISLSQGYTPKVIDTLSFGKDKVVLYENHTWYYAGETGNIVKTGSGPTIMDSFWDCEDLFPYRKMKSLYPEHSELNLTSQGDTFILPVYGKIWGGFTNWHTGIDIELKKGDPVKAAFSGKVRYAQYNYGGYGNLVIIRHYNGLETYYAHLSQIWVGSNQVVKAGDVIGLGGSTGRAYGTHLHFETRYLDRPFDPLSFIDFEGKKLSQSKITIDNRSPASSNTIQPMNLQNAAYYTIRNGDCLSSIAHKCGTTVGQLCRLNNISTRTILRAGRTIRIR